MTTRIEALEALAEAARRTIRKQWFSDDHPLVEALAALDAAPVDISDAAAEREKIVAWLREVADGSSGAHFRSTLIFAVDAIERGEHDKTGDE